MFKRFRKPLAIAAFVVTGVIGGSAFAQFWGNLPITGGPAFCSSTVNNNCVNTVPAAPPITGNETIPADTNASGGQMPQTVKLPLRAINAAPIAYNLCTSATCGTVALTNNSGGVLFDYSTTITSATVDLPIQPIDGQHIVIASSNTITSLTVVAGIQTSLAVSTPTVLTASTTTPQGYEFMYVDSVHKWYRVY